MSMHWLRLVPFTLFAAYACVDRPDCPYRFKCAPPPDAGDDGGSAGETNATSGTSGTNATSGASGTSTAGMSGGSSGGASAGAGDAPGIAGDSGAAGIAVGTPCDTTKTPGTESCLLSDDYALFVAPTGKDSASGTMAAPLATLTAATSLAAGKKFVIVCDSTYDERVVVSSGAQVFGGFSCAGGNWAAEAKAPLFKPSGVGPALRIDAVTDAIVLDTVNFEVPDAKVAGGTAITALVNASPSVTLKNVRLTAGAGMNASDGTLDLFSYQPLGSLNGNPETIAGSGGGEKDCACQTGLKSIGGTGGTPVSTGQNGSRGAPDHGGGQPGAPDNSDCGNGGSGKKGGDATAAAASNGATTLGTISSSGWSAASGVDGVIGSPGQGGGGGASLNNFGHGGGGGCGGCGGNGAKAGQGGGGSIALLAVSSTITLEGCTLTTKDAGNGGAGAVGQPGQQEVGGGGSALSQLNSCAGGNGGKGGAGGASGGGAGGVSVGIVWRGATAPTLTSSTIVTGKAGAKGIGGMPGQNDGIVGVKQDLLQVL